MKISADKNFDSTQRYVALDGLRGILAITVVVHHYAQLYHLDWMGKAWISVDAFFILSGFVITHSYSKKIQAGMNFAAFAKLRLLRLYPMYLLGFLLGFGGLLLEFQQANITSFDLTFAMMSGLLILPYFNQIAWPVAGVLHVGTVFPMNDPAWSLFFELFVNVLFFVWLTRPRRPSSAVICAAAFLCYLLAAQFFGIHSGWGSSNFAGGISRVIFYFSLGCIVYSIHLKLPQQTLFRAAAVALLLIIGFTLKNTLVTYLLLLIISPLAILIASRTNIPPPSNTAAIFLRLGSLSYPLYITHFPLAIVSHWAISSTGISSGMSVLVATLFALAVAVPLAAFEPALRRKLTGLFMPANRGAAT